MNTVTERAESMDGQLGTHEFNARSSRCYHPTHQTGQICGVATVGFPIPPTWAKLYHRRAAAGC